MRDVEILVNRDPHARWPAGIRPPEKRRAAALASALALHLAAGLLLLMMPAPRQPEAVPQPVTVRLVPPPKPAQPSTPSPDSSLSQASFLSRLGQDEQPAQRRAVRPGSQQPAPANPSNGLKAATDFYAAQILDEPRNKQARAALKTLAAEDRLIQVCNVEAMEQVRRAAALKPDFVAAYALADLAFSGDAVTAEGAAIHAGHRWYQLRYRCALSGEDRVSAFAFALGNEIPRKEWAAHNLTEAASAD